MPICSARALAFPPIHTTHVSSPVSLTVTLTLDHERSSLQKLPHSPNKYCILLMLDSMIRPRNHKQTRIRYTLCDGSRLIYQSSSSACYLARIKREWRRLTGRAYPVLLAHDDQSIGFDFVQRVPIVEVFLRSRVQHHRSTQWRSHHPPPRRTRVWYALTPTPPTI